MFCASTFSTLPEASRPAMPLAFGRKNREIAVPAVRQARAAASSSISVASSGYLLSIGGEEFRPLPPRLCAARADAGGEMLVDAVGDQKLRVLGPAVSALGEADLLFAERFAVGFGRVLFVRRAIADVAVENDERWAALGLPEDIQRLLDAFNVVGVAHAQNVPAVA